MHGTGLAENPNLSLITPSARRFSGLEPLIDAEFLVVSEAYRRWVRAHADRTEQSETLQVSNRGPIRAT